jgi:hypothetical protein
LTTVVEVGVVSAFDPSLDSLAARLVTQALLAVTLVGIAFVVSAGSRGGVSSPSALGLRRPVRSPIRLAAAAYLAYGEEVETTGLKALPMMVTLVPSWLAETA